MSPKLQGNATGYASQTISYVFSNLGTVLHISWFPMVLAFGLLFGGLAYATWGSAIELIAATADIAPDDDAAILAAWEEAFTPSQIAAIVSIIAASIAALFLASASVAAAVSRAVVLDEKPKGLLHFRITGREITVVITYVAISVLSLVVGGGVMFSLFLLGIVLSAGAQNEAVGVLVVIPGMFMAILMMFYMHARLSMAVPISAVEGGIGIGRAWRFTSGAGMKMFWLYLLTTLAVVGISMVSSMVLQLFATPLIFMGMDATTPEALQGIVAMGLVLLALYYAAYQAFAMAVMVTTFAIPYKEIRAAAANNAIA